MDVATVILIFTTITNAQQMIGGKIVEQGTWKGEQVQYAKGEVAIILKPGVEALSLKPLIEAYGAKIIREFDERGWGLIELPENAKVLSIAAEFETNINISSAEPNMVVSTAYDPYDPDYQNGKQWYLKNVGQNPPGGTSGADIDAARAWEITIGDSLDTLAVLDSGIPLINGHLSHPDLDNANRYILGPDYSHDGDVLIEVRDNNGHGTHVTGILAAETDNYTGISGVAGNCKVLVIQVFNTQGLGYYSYFYNGVVYAVNHGAKIINYSGGGLSASASAELAVDYAKDHDVLVVAAAGNDHGGPVRYPAAYSADYSNVIAVGATDADDVIAEYSNVGSEVNVVAPGGFGSSFDEDDIYSTTPNYSAYLNTIYGVSQNFGYLPGTSMATPQVSGIAAMVLDLFPNKTPGQVRTIIEKSAEDLGTAGFDTTYGHGRVNAYYAVAAPDAPSSLSISGGQDDHPQLHWTHPEAPDVSYIHIKRTIDGSNTYFMVAGTLTSWTDNQIYIDTDPRSEPVTYQVRARDYTLQYSPYSNPVSTVTGMIPMSEGSGQEIALFSDESPDAFTLESPSPNPFNARTTLRFGLPVAGQVRLEVFDINGRIVTTLLDGERPAGWSTITWDASSVASGTYFLLAKIGGEVHNRKLVVIK